MYTRNRFSYTEVSCWSTLIGTPSGAGTNLKMGGGHRSGAKVGVVAPLHFLALKAQLVVLVSALVMVSTVWSVSCLLLFYSRCPP